MTGDASSRDFRFDAGLDERVEGAARALLGASHVVALTGAGLSVESGIPHFRGPGGLWTKYGEPPMDGYQRFLRDPKGFWEETLEPKAPWAKALGETLAAAKPNSGHLALAELERRGHLGALITQNIDDLHRQAGSRELLEIHGNHSLLRCVECNTRFTREELPIDPAELPPRCPGCGGVVKGDTVQFGEPIPADVLGRCYREVARADCMIVAGTSATVFPAADFPVQVSQKGGVLIEINPEDTDLTPLASHALRGPGGALLERLLHHVVQGSPA